jgi:hypothetical protein
MMKPHAHTKNVNLKKQPDTQGYHMRKQSAAPHANTGTSTAKNKAATKGRATNKTGQSVRGKPTAGHVADAKAPHKSTNVQSGSGYGMSNSMGT